MDTTSFEGLDGSAVFTAVLTDIWATLAYGAQNAADPFHMPVIGTVSAQETELRTVVLRRVMPEERRLIFHTDIRSGKIAEIQNNPTIGWLFYNPTTNIQLRVASQAAVQTEGDLVDDQWAASTLSSRRCYLAPYAPSTKLTTFHPNLPDQFVERLPTNKEVEAGRKNFAVVVCQMQSIDWLYLAANGHRRIKFTWQNGDLTATWLAA